MSTHGFGRRSQFTRSNATQSMRAKSPGKRSSSSSTSCLSRQLSQNSSDGDCGDNAATAAAGGGMNISVISSGRSSSNSRRFSRSNSIGATYSRSNSNSKTRSMATSTSASNTSSKDSSQSYDSNSVDNNNTTNTKDSNHSSSSGRHYTRSESSHTSSRLTSKSQGQGSSSSLVVVERSSRSKSPLGMRMSSFWNNSIQKRTKSTPSLDKASSASSSSSTAAAAASTSTMPTFGYRHSVRKSDTITGSGFVRREWGGGGGGRVNKYGPYTRSSAAAGRKTRASSKKEFEALEDAKLAALKKPPTPGARQQPMEGLILKFTNVVKGYQNRWLVLDPESGMLEYFEKEEHKKQRPRGSVHLAAAVVSPSEEDSQTFIVNAANGEIYKLRASDARERQLWVDRIRSTAEHHTAHIAQFPQHSPKLVRRDSFSSQSNRRTDSGRRARGSVESLPTSKRSPRDEAFQEVKEFHLDAEDCLRNLEDKISALSPSGEHINSLDSELLLLKATSSATLRCVQDCITLLQNAEPPKKRSPQSSPRSPLVSDQPRLSVTETDGGVDYQANLPKEEEEVLDEELYEDKDLEGVEEHKSIILHLLSQLKLGMDLTKVVLPTFILERRSLLEMFADCMAHPDAFLKIPDIQDPEGRMLAVLEWYLTSFHNGRKGTIAKKPYNPIIGETFHCSWTLKDNQENSSASHRLSYVAEQVSHHPPTFYFECPTKKVKINASIYTKSKFMGMSIGVSMVGKVRLRLEEFDEDYVFTLPSAYARSILTVPWVEMGDKVSLNCDKTGYQASIIFHTKPFYGGKLHHITADAKNTKTGESICKVQGQWNGVMDFTYTSGDSQSVDVTQLHVTRKSVRPIEKQEEHESRKLWHHVTNALRLNDMNTATEHKKGLEEVQREGERHRKAMDLPYIGKFFDNVDGSWVHKNLPKTFMQETKQ